MRPPTTTFKDGTFEDGVPSMAPPEMLVTSTTESMKAYNDKLPFFPQLAHYVKRGRVLSSMQQTILFGKTAGIGWRWRKEDRMFTFVDDSEAPLFAFRAHMVASLAPGPKTILWGWAHPTHEDEPLNDTVYGLAEADECQALLTPELPFPEWFPSTGRRWDETTPAAERIEKDVLFEMAIEVGYAITGLTGRGPFYAGSGGNRSRQVYFLEQIQPVLPEFTIYDLLYTPSYANCVHPTDWPIAFEFLARARGWHSVRLPNPDPLVVVLALDDGSMSGEIHWYQGRLEYTSFTSTTKGTAKTAVDNA